MGTPEMQEKYKQGPVGFMTLLPPGVPTDGQDLVQWFLFSVLISVFVAYLTRLALNPGADYMAVFRVAGTVAVLGYALTDIPNSIWKGASWSSTAKFIFDGIVYGLLTAGTFAWQWPALI